MKNFAALSLAIASAAAQAATPSPCSDPVVLESVQEILWTENLGLGAVPTPRKRKAFELYSAFGLKNVVSTNFNPASQTSACTAALTTGALPIEVNYTVRPATGQAGALMLQVEFVSLSRPLARHLREGLAEALRTEP